MAQVVHRSHFVVGADDLLGEVRQTFFELQVRGHHDFSAAWELYGIVRLGEGEIKLSRPCAAAGGSKQYVGCACRPRGLAGAYFLSPPVLLRTTMLNTSRRRRMPA